MRLLITGGAGFIGSNFVKQILRRPDIERVIVLDALTYAGNINNLPLSIRRDPRFLFWRGDIRDGNVVNQLVSQNDVVVHFAAETHVDNSIYNSDDFVESDVRGSQVLLNAVNLHGIERFIHISTSEVYGTAQTEFMDEKHALNPRSPYASAKTGADRLAYSYWATFDCPIVIVRPFNNYGPNQHVEKLIPCFITRALQDLPLPMHGDGYSTRDWIFVEDTCRGVEAILDAPREAVIGEVFNLGTGIDTSVEQITRSLLDLLGKPYDLIRSVPNRPGQVDCHRADYTKIKKLTGWEPQVRLKEGLQRTVQWYIENREWWSQLASKDTSRRPWWDLEGMEEARQNGKLGALLMRNGH